LTGSRALAMDSKMSVRITRPCRALPSGEPQNPRTGGDPDTAARYPLPDYARQGARPSCEALECQTTQVLSLVLPKIRSGSN
jgi:hypothetical protein